MTADSDWRPYTPGDDHTVVGDVRISETIDAPDLHADRRLLAYLPPSYADSEESYPVVYMHDGQNLFDEGESYSGEWRVDETMQRLSEEGTEAIVVGVPNAGDARGDEYTPFPHPEHGGGGADAYLEFLFETVKPLVDETFRTRPGRDHTGLAGSSLGGVVSLYGFFEYPDHVGFAGVLSPAFWWPGEPLFEYVAAQSRTDGRLYVDVGGREAPDDPELNEAYLRDAERMVGRLRTQGFEDERLRFVVDEEARHRESAWAERFPGAIRFLLG
ncbi:Predicted hydrolase of the alpha/beta superfamily [Halogranum amylolyticum]|uniref:Predicted hydrolase of the alpha/beta superfamily n=1 Tax=Halogranum amylolyticum TaxID=660520 RepID=A0A1H8PXB0_9EURY|nr:alpha/beta hydrolase-fold protein [Halogranum amylolyticum]SEO46436.1 Predicted hydrolase of the alpha/beta superfamily [Halogranum amylolyticum]